MKRDRQGTENKKDMYVGVAYFWVPQYWGLLSVFRASVGPFALDS